MKSIIDLLSLGPAIMTEDKPDPKQEISAGDGSHNYQAARDMHVHNPPEQKRESPIVRPSSGDIRKYDPKLGLIMNAADMESRKLLIQFSSARYSKPYLLRTRLVLLVIFLYLLAMSVFLGVGPFEPFYWIYSMLKSVWNTL
jgi:hypothetical protein